MGVLLAIDIHLACNQSGTGDTIDILTYDPYNHIYCTGPYSCTNPQTLYGLGTDTGRSDPAIGLHSMMPCMTTYTDIRLYLAMLSCVCVCTCKHCIYVRQATP